MPIMLQLYNRTRRLPPEARADPLACFVHIYRVLQARLCIQSIVLPFWELEYLREEILCGRMLDFMLRELDEWMVNVDKKGKSNV